MCRTAFLLGSIALGCSLLLPSAGKAQCRLCEGMPGIAAEDAPKTPVELELQSTLKFDRLVLAGPGTGRAVLTPDGDKIVSGSLGDFSSAGLVGSVIVRGEPGRLLRIDMPRLVELHSLSGATAVVDQISTDLPTAPRLDSNGRLTFRFGGRLTVDGEADGDYRGDLAITADYL